MLRSFTSFMTGSNLMKHHDEILRQNRSAIRYFSVMGIPVSLASIAAQTIVKSAPPTLTQNGSWLSIYFLILLLADRFLIPDDWPHTTKLIYFLQAPVLLVSIFLGTIWDPNHQALTFLMFMVIMPVFVLDYPWRVTAVMAGWNLFFLLLCFTVKDPSTRRGDLIHVLQFFLSSIFVTMIVLKLRFDLISGFERIQYHMEHDTLTATRNRQSLEARIDFYMNKPLFLLVTDLDKLSMLNDFYGREIGDNVLSDYASILQEIFEEDNVYRYGGAEFLCVMPYGKEEACLSKIDECRQKFKAMHRKGIPDSTCSFAYVSGTPHKADVFRNMVQLAELLVHRELLQRMGGTIGCVYNKEALRAGMVESNISTHLRAHETNQLTGLPGMEYFVSHCDELLNTVVFMDLRPVIGYLNVLHLHLFNDAFGYSQGDKLVCDVADRLRESFPNRHIAYLSGGRFAVMCYLNEAEPGIERVNKAFEGYRSNFTVEIKAGFAEYRRGDFVISLLDNAKLAHDSIYSVKDTQCHFYDEKLDEQRQLHQYLLTHLDEAIEKKWIKVYYQPIIRALSGEISNLEALARWDDPQYGFLMPFKFIPLLEDERVIYKLNLYVVRQVIEDFNRIEEAGLPLVPISVNLSRYDFFECDMVTEITRALDRAGRPHSLLKIEITESAFIENTSLLKNEIERFHANGLQVWMDDFGSEYSTLNILNELNFDLIKIDMQFMKNFSESGRNAIIIYDVIGMSKHLGIETLVEGVETQEHYEALRRLGSEKLQGYHFARPIPLEAVLDAIQKGDLHSPETSDRMLYYTQLGQINLHSPLSDTSADGFIMAQNIPAAIVELRDDKCLLVRDNKSLYEKRHVLFPGFSDKTEVSLSDLPECYVSALMQAKDSDSEDWLFNHGAISDSQSVSIHSKKIASGNKDCVAVLIVILPG